MVFAAFATNSFASKVRLIFGGLKLTVSWSLEVVENWLEECEERGEKNCFEKAWEKFGTWHYSMSYEAYMKIRNEFLRILEENNMPLKPYIDLFSCMPETKITYKEETYKTILNVLEEVSRRNPHLKVRIETLKAIVENAKKLKSNITCRG